MYKTEYGDFDGNSWEDFCQMCFKHKYEKDGYQELPAWQGDLGIEGYTREGKVFQCYCPDENYNFDILYEKQRDKITKDLKKIKKNQNELKKYLGSQKIVCWIFVTPEYKNKELIRHCAEKAIEYRNENLDILDPKFDILVHDLDFFKEQIPLIIDGKGKKIELNHLDETNENISLWSNSEVDLVENAKRKNNHRINPNAKNRDVKIQKLTDHTITNFINGNVTIKLLEQKFPDDYEKLIRVISQFEKKVEESCITNEGSSKELYDSIEFELKSRISKTLSYIDDITIIKLTEQILADWILRCPIDFE